MLKNRRNRKEEDLFSRLDSVVSDLGYILVDVYLRRDHGVTTLRLLCDKPGGISVDELETISNACDPLLDSWGEDSHDYFEVQSPGLTRPLESLRELRLHQGDTVDIGLFQKYDNKKKFRAVIIAADEEKLVVEDTEGERMSLPHEQVSLVKQIIDF
ncbi:MAG: hypothetical protein Q4E09_00775 [Eubacteriales bacterium]|nr:hypothetical protein [Eubacteriales bacterium]